MNAVNFYIVQIRVSLQPRLMNPDQIAERLERHKEFLSCQQHKFFVNADNILALLGYMYRRHGNKPVDEDALRLAVVVLAQDHWTPWVPEKAEELILQVNKLLKNHHRFPEIGNKCSSIYIVSVFLHCRCKMSVFSRRRGCYLP